MSKVKRHFPFERSAANLIDNRSCRSTRISHVARNNRIEILIIPGNIISRYEQSFSRQLNYNFSVPG